MRMCREKKLRIRLISQKLNISFLKYEKLMENPD
ncbi:hypothetical protein W822_10975 [Advenella kashmirensis W13003]|uniref:Uncharacterized protein n=1 Tax=Advenella kashmirensis W13003 TaxID=1424334 RepID=V8QUC4_9BURK|nr:hypothetical protein W822_10975 [Advenella kashmirensis W13003]